MWIEREIEALVLRRAAQRPAVALTGARQTGKTSLTRHLFPGHAFVTLDLPSEAAQAAADPAGFFQRHPPPVVIDEVQYAPAVLRHLKVAIETARKANGRYILTGSQKLPLMQSLSETLAGRVDVIELEGLSWHEVSATRPAVPEGPEGSVERAVFRGGFPELCAEPGIDSDGFFRSYVATYLERDLRQQLQVTSLLDFERFLRACALRTAQVLNKAELARDVGISGSTASQWLSALVASNQVALLEPWFTNRTKSLVKAPKLYLCDSGLAAFLVGLRDAAALHDSPMAGALWETFVFSEIRRRQAAASGGWTLHYWRDRTKEADFLLHRGGRFVLADAKWTPHPSARDASTLSRVAAELPRNSVTQQLVVCRTPNPFPLSPGLSAVPVSDIDPLVG